MKVNDPPDTYREQGAVPVHSYRVVFWEQQLPSSDDDPETYGWSELTVDLSEAEDVFDAIRWAEVNLNHYLDLYGAGAAHGERLYSLFVEVPGADYFLHIAGHDPVVAPGSVAQEAGNLRPKRPS